MYFLNGKITHTKKFYYHELVKTSEEKQNDSSKFYVFSNRFWTKHKQLLMKFTKSSAECV